MSSIAIPDYTGIKIFNDFSIKELTQYINWASFFHEWRINGKYPALLNDPEKGPEASKLFVDAQCRLKQICEEKWLTANGVTGIFPANSIGDDIEVYDPKNQQNILSTFHFLRNQQFQNEKPNYCLADFVAPKETKITDFIGCFAVTAGIGVEKKVGEFINSNDNYGALLLQTLANRLAEAFSELLHLKIRKEIWGYAKDENLSVDELFLGKYRGIRPAPGYAACPDHSSKAEIFKVLHATEKTGITLTETFMMSPASSVCGWYFAHPDAKYFSVGKISREQLLDYSRRKNITVQEARKWL